MRRLLLVALVASVACGTQSSSQAQQNPAPAGRPTGGGYQDATPLSQTTTDVPLTGGATTGSPGVTSSPTVATVGSQFSVTGTAPIVRGDNVRAREQALAAAMKSAVSAAAKQSGTTAGPEILSKARSYVKRYSITREQKDPEETYTVEVDAEVDLDKLKDAIADTVPAGNDSMAASPTIGTPVQSPRGPARTVLLTVHHIRRAKDLRGVAELLRADSRVREVRQQLYKQQRAILEVDIAGSAEDVANIILPFTTEDGVTLVIDKRTDGEVESTLKLPL